MSLDCPALLESQGKWPTSTIRDMDSQKTCIFRNATRALLFLKPLFLTFFFCMGFVTRASVVLSAASVTLRAASVTLSAASVAFGAASVTSGVVSVPFSAVSSRGAGELVVGDMVKVEVDGRDFMMLMWGVA